MTQPAVSPFAERVYEALGPFTEQDEQHGWPLLKFTDILTRAAADVETFAADQEDGTPGWVTLLDPATCPAKGLPFLGQMIGVAIPPGTSDVTARALIAAKGGWGRGTPAAVIAAGQMALTGSKHLTLTERNGSPYRVGVTTYEAETPDTTALHNAVNAALPAGLVATFTLLVGWTVAQAETFFAGQSVADAEVHFAGQAVADAEHVIP